MNQLSLVPACDKHGCEKVWIKDRHRKLMQPGRYTELFFLDEATAYAAGHRPCAECRRAACRADGGEKIQRRQ